MTGSRQSSLKVINQAQESCLKVINQKRKRTLHRKTALLEEMENLPFRLRSSKNRRLSASYGRVELFSSDSLGTDLFFKLKWYHVYSSSKYLM
jgi:hypothetical protein